MGAKNGTWGELSRSIQIVALSVTSECPVRDRGRGGSSVWVPLIEGYMAADLSMRPGTYGRASEIRASVSIRLRETDSMTFPTTRLCRDDSICGYIGKERICVATDSATGKSPSL